jgi:DNA polymerase III delta prime subunit
MTQEFNTEAQTQLFIGPINEVTEFVQNGLQQILCKKSGCKTCVRCAQIRQNEHPNVYWLRPEKQYTLEQLEIVFEKIAFALDDNEKFFIVIESADLLNQACSNKLLKSIEEPKAGYYFLFLSQRKENILPTIRSRCVTTAFYNNGDTLNNSELFNFFINSNSSPLMFLKTLDKINISEIESIELLDALIKHWSLQAKQELLNSNIENYEHVANIIAILESGFKKPPMPGSSKTFWKNLYLKMH